MPASALSMPPDAAERIPPCSSSSLRQCRLFAGLKMRSGSVPQRAHTTPAARTHAGQNAACAHTLQPSRACSSPPSVAAPWSSPLLLLPSPPPRAPHRHSAHRSIFGASALAARPGGAARARRKAPRKGVGEGRRPRGTRRRGGGTRVGGGVGVGEGGEGRRRRLALWRGAALAAPEGRPSPMRNPYQMMGTYIRTGKSYHTRVLSRIHTHRSTHRHTGTHTYTRPRAPARVRTHAPVQDVLSYARTHAHARTHASSFPPPFPLFQTLRRAACASLRRPPP